MPDPVSPDALLRMPALHGETMKEAFNTCDKTPKFLVDELLTEDASLMLTGDGAVGKSTISGCAAAAMTTGSPVFGQFTVPRPLRVYYALGERNWKEPVRRLKTMFHRLPVDFENFWITDSFTGTCDFLQLAQCDNFIRTVERDCPHGPEVLFLEPIYPFVAGAISEDRVGNLLVQRFTRIKKVFGCALWFTHHNIKVRQDGTGNWTRPLNPFFGSIWIFNHVQIQYNAERIGKQTILTLLKDTDRVLLPSIPLDFDEETGVVTLSDELGPLNKTNRAHLFLKAREADKRTWTRDEIMAFADLSRAQMNRVHETGPWKGRVVNISSEGKAACYKLVDSK